MALAGKEMNGLSQIHLKEVYLPDLLSSDSTCDLFFKILLYSFTLCGCRAVLQADSAQTLKTGFCHESSEVNVAVVGRAVTV